MAMIERKRGGYTTFESQHVDEFGYAIAMRAEVRDGQVREATLRTSSLNPEEISIATLFWTEGGVDQLVRFLKAVEAEQA